MARRREEAIDEELLEAIMAAGEAVSKKTPDKLALENELKNVSSALEGGYISRDVAVRGLEEITKEANKVKK